ncbi:MAG: peptide chain release factor N(5)-glutamine methyltransferase [bacterium]|nr:peptide chain release factor N(5)-glutamine methyltransferase [bacterium]
MSSPETPGPQNVGEMQTMARSFLQRKGIEESRLEADLLVAHALKMDRLGMLLHLDKPLLPEEVDTARELLVRRSKREPVAYITGQREFYGRNFHVGSGALIPRPESELFIDLVKQWGKDGLLPQKPRFFDLGTGSGCLAISLSLEIPDAQVGAVDLSPEALEWACRNGAELGSGVTFHEGDGFEVSRAQGPFDVWLSNPPYVRLDEGAAMEPEVRDYEPAQALFAPEGDPDHFVRRLLDDFPEVVAPGGFLLVELGHDQAERALAMAAQRNLSARIESDLARIPRLLIVGPRG